MSVVSLGAAGLVSPAAAAGPVSSGLSGGVGTSAEVKPSMLTRPKITGAHQPGSTLRVSQGTWGGEPTSFAYLWQACTTTVTDGGAPGPVSCRTIGDTSPGGSPTVTLSQEELGWFVRARVTASNEAGSLSPYTAAGPTVGLATPIRRPTVAGVAEVGKTLTATSGDWNGAPLDFSFRWQACQYDTANKLSCTDAGDATAAGPNTRSSFTLEEAQRGKRMRVLVSASNGFGPSAGSPSGLSAAVSPSRPVLVTRPVVDGVPAVGQTLSVTDGLWNPTPASHRYQWQRCTIATPSAPTACTNVGTDQATYTPVEADRGAQVRATVTAVNTTGGTAASTSPLTRVIDAPTNTDVPVISRPSEATGAPKVGETLTTTTGTWAGTQATYTYMWQACTTNPGINATCTTISKNPTATLAPATRGKHIRVLVTATNAYGVRAASSSTTTLVDPAPAVKQIDSGWFHACAVTATDAARCWGYSPYGEAEVPADLGTISQISSGWHYTCAVTTADAARCWGRNDYAQATVPNDLGRVTQISAGFLHTCAVTIDNAVRCWGRDDLTGVPSDLGAVTQIDTGVYNTCAITTADTARCWGNNSYLINDVPADLGTVTNVSVDDKHACAVTTTGAARCWGTSDYGQTAVPDDLGTATEISTGPYGSCAITTAGTARCWGTDFYGQASPPQDLGTVTQIDASMRVSCAVTTTGLARCWGSEGTFESVPDDLS